VANVLAPKPESFEKHLLERQHHRQPVYRGREPPSPAGTPGPELGRDVVQHFCAHRVRRFRHSNVETGIVHQNDKIVSAQVEIIPERPQQAIVRPDLGDYFYQTECREPFHPIPEGGASSGDLGAAQGLDDGIRIAGPESANDARSVEIARRLAGRNKDARPGSPDHQ
jgi:hypothetical protein